MFRLGQDQAFSDPALFEALFYLWCNVNKGPSAWDIKPQFLPIRFHDMNLLLKFTNGVIPAQAGNQDKYLIRPPLQKGDTGRFSTRLSNPPYPPFSKGGNICSNDNKYFVPHPH
jgi:hypothetical protein